MNTIAMEHAWLHLRCLAKETMETEALDATSPLSCSVHAKSLSTLATHRECDLPFALFFLHPPRQMSSSHARHMQRWDTPETPRVPVRRLNVPLTLLLGNRFRAAASAGQHPAQTSMGGDRATAALPEGMRGALAADTLAVGRRVGGVTASV